jgi:acetylornithine deacetylase/succinyl-diaminopimelate desuccinylase-like protein
MSLERALELARAGRAAAEADLFEELRIPSVSTLPEHRDDVRRNCEWLADRFRSLGLDTSITDQVDGGHPVLRADWRGADGAPTLTIYGHYDVQPPDPLAEWTTPPFEPTVRDGRLYARGSADDKGQVFCLLKALEAPPGGRPPVNLRFLIEGQEEHGSQVLFDLIKREPQRVTYELAQAPWQLRLPAP